jgi:aspartyl aminopeptidase
MASKKIINPKNEAEAKDLEFEAKSCWDVYSSSSHRKKMADLSDRYREFLSQCKTEREVIDFIADLARKAGFSEDLGSDKVLRVFRGKSLMLARKGKKGLEHGFRLLGAHADSPRLDFKQHPLYEEAQIGLAKTHYYGGIRKHQWLARPLALHGVVVKHDGTVVNVNIGEDPGDPVFTVMDILPHLAYGQMEKKLAKAFEAEKLNVVLGHEPAPEKNGKAKKGENGKGGNNKIKAHVLALLNERYGIKEEDLFSAELQAVPAGPARDVGLDGQLMGGYGHDDRVCCFASVEALLSSSKPEHTQVVILWDKEEIGSDGATGAKSLFMEYAISDLIDAWSPGVPLQRAFLEAKAISGDVHGAMDPDYQDLHEKLNSSLMGYGPVMCKYTGSRGKYGANDASAEYVGWLRGLFNEAGVPWQMAELGKVDLGGGGTVAKFLAVYGMDVIDCGPSVLGMHSPFEVLSKADLYATVQAYREFLES